MIKELLELEFEITSQACGCGITTCLKRNDIKLFYIGHGEKCYLTNFNNIDLIKNKSYECTPFIDLDEIKRLCIMSDKYNESS